MLSITEEDIPSIQTTVYTHWDKGRTHISRVLCEQWDWRQPNGRLKDMACREILLTLKRKGFISLPPGCHNGNNKLRNRSIPVVETDQIKIPPIKSSWPLQERII